MSRPVDVRKTSEEPDGSRRSTPKKSRKSAAMACAQPLPFFQQD